MAVATLQEAIRDEGRVAELMGVINAATAELVRVIAEVDAAGTWKGDGIRSLEHWVAWHCGMSGARAARLVHMARRREELPLATGAFTAGEISEDQAAVVYARVSPDNDRNATDIARHATVSQLRRTIPRPPTPPEAADAGTRGTGGAGRGALRLGRERAVVVPGRPGPGPGRAGGEVPACEPAMSSSPCVSPMPRTPAPVSR